MSLLADKRPTRSTSAFTYAEQFPSPPTNEENEIQIQSQDDVRKEEWCKIINTLIDIGRLNDDWDGEGSPAPERGVVAGATKLAKDLCASQWAPANRVVASVNGTVVFEWYPTKDEYIEIEITSPVDGELRTVGEEARSVKFTLA